MLRLFHYGFLVCLELIFIAFSLFGLSAFNAVLADPKVPSGAMFLSKEKAAVDNEWLPAPSFPETPRLLSIEEVEQARRLVGSDTQYRYLTAMDRLVVDRAVSHQRAWCLWRELRQLEEMELTVVTPIAIVESLDVATQLRIQQQRQEVQIGDLVLPCVVARPEHHLIARCGDQCGEDSSDQSVTLIGAIEPLQYLERGLWVVIKMPLFHVKEGEKFQLYTTNLGSAKPVSSTSSALLSRLVGELELKQIRGRFGLAQVTMSLEPVQLSTLVINNATHK